MSVLAHAHGSFRGVVEDILAPLLARLATISAQLDSAAPRPGIRRGPPPPAAAGDAVCHARARELLETVRRRMAQLEAVFRRIDDAERRIRHCFDPVEQHLDDALRHAPPDAGRIYAGLLAVDAGIGVIKAGIREVYSPVVFQRDGGGAGDGSPTTPLVAASSAATATAAAAKKMAELHRGSQMSHLRLAVGGLEARLRGCVLCLAAFPDGAVVKKRLLLHWWLAEGFVDSAADGKRRFDELVAKGFVVPPPAALSGTVHRCTVRPVMRDLLVSVARRGDFLELRPGDLAFLLGGGGGGARHTGSGAAAARAIYNVGQKYVEVDERWFAGGKKGLRVLQLGQWREFTTGEQIADPMGSHIEISGVERLRDMGSCCKSLRYVSFRGISGMESLPDSIGKLRELVVLDLRACHNLEELGRGVTMLDRLEFLDVSECHLLAGVPRGLGQLTRLEVLKGFVVANSSSKDLCHLNELAKLERLRKLGIVIGKMAAPTEDEFLKLGEFKALQSLKISWGVLSSTKNGVTETSSLARMRFALPPNLIKLDLHCFPLADFAQWVRPSAVRKLYIRGGKLATFGDEDGWEAEVLRLRFLSDLRCDHGRLRRLFSKLRLENTEIHECPNFLVPGTGSDVGESAESHGEIEEFVVCNEVVM
ncbi:hypothetical protein ACP4OV_002224 [Aristida adscensionis]